MSRVKWTAVWCAVLAAFAVFTMALLGGLAGVGSAATMAQAVTSLTANEDPSQGALVVVSASSRFPQFNRLFGLKPNVEVCWLTKDQLGAVQSRWETTVSPINGSYSLVSVAGPTEDELRDYVSGSVSCVLVKYSSTFFLPLDGTVS